MTGLISLLTDQGVAVVGCADLAPVPEKLTRGFPRAVSFGLALTPAIIAGIMEGPTDDYWGEYNRTNALLLELAEAGAEWLRGQGFAAHPCRATGDIDPATLTAPFPHKTAARLAGLGWIGKCALLVNPDYGTAVRWNTILTDAPLATAPAPLPCGCGDCRVCVDVCPGQAASGKNWEEGLAREDFFDARACVRGCQKVTAERQTVSKVCGLCVARCPHTVAYLRRVGAL